MNDTFDGPFSLLQMFWGNIAARRLRSLLSVIAIAIQVILVLMIVGLTSGVISEWGKRVEGVGADILVQPPNSSIFFAFSSAVMQESLGDQMEALPSVDAPDEALADDIIAQAKHLKVGDHVNLLNHSFTISGIVGHGKGARFFIPLRTAQEIAGVEKRVSMFYVRSRGNSEAARAEILRLDPKNRVRSMGEYVTLMSSSKLPELRPFIRSMVGLGIVISFLVVLLNMHTMVMERTREVGILKALGFSRLDVVQMLLGETLVLTLLGSGLGIALTFLTQAILKETSPSLMILISLRWVFSSILLALAGAALGAAYAAFRAASYDPVVALAYE